MDSPSKHPLWTVEREWDGETAVLVGGGTSLDGFDFERLRGRRVIAINSAYMHVPFADICFFGDARWWNAHFKKAAMVAFAGRTVTVSESVHAERVLHLKRVTPPPGFTDERNAAVSQRTSLQGALNVAAHLGTRRVILLGADARRAEDGKTHFHTPHEWKNKPGNRTWDIQMKQLGLIVEPLRERGIEVINASLISRLPWWRKMTFEEAICLPS